MADFLLSYQHIFVFLALLCIMYLVYKEAGLEFELSKTPPSTSGMLGQLWGTFPN